jgi:hypothetical protein
MDSNELAQGDLRYGEPLLAREHDEGGNNGQGEGDLEPKGGAPADRAGDVDLAAYFLDIGFDHIHADAAARDIGDLLGR